MLYKTKRFLESRLGEQVIRNKFLWIPTSFKNDKYGRFWSWEDIVYEVNRIDDDWGQSTYYWQPIRFASDQDYDLIPTEKVAKKKYKLFRIYLDIIAMIIFFITFNSTGLLISGIFFWFDIFAYDRNEM